MNLDVIKQSKNTILLCEVGVLLHDVGKFIKKRRKRDDTSVYPGSSWTS